MKHTDHWLCGYAAAMANVIRCFRQYDTVAKTMQADGITLEMLVKAGAEAFDTSQLIPCFRKEGR